MTRVRLNKESLITRREGAYYDVEPKIDCLSFVFLQLERKPARSANPSRPAPPRPGRGRWVASCCCRPPGLWQCHSATRGTNQSQAQGLRIDRRSQQRRSFPVLCLRACFVPSWSSSRHPCPPRFRPSAVTQLP